MSYVIIILAMVITTVMLWLAPKLNMTVNGEAVNMTINDLGEAPGVWDVIGWVWDNIVFLFQFSTFQVDDMPWFVVLIFDVINILCVWMIVRLVRGSGD